MYADDSSLRESKIILLKNRQLIRGEIALHGNHYLVIQPHTEIRLPQEQVERICQNLGDAYLYLQHQIRFGKAADHLRLAQWCLDENLLREAQAQLDEGILKRPDHPRVDLIRRQLELANQIRQTDRSEQRPQRLPTDAKELEEIFDHLPSQVVESFTRVVQPILLNSCSTRGCHGMGADNQFLLHRSARGRQPSRRVTLRNLQSVIQWIDHENVENSPLLYFAGTPHFASSTQQRGSRRDSWSPESITARRLSAWMQYFVVEDNNELRKSVASAPEHATVAKRTAASRISSNALFNLAESDVNSGLKTQAHGDRSRRALTFRPRDPFDPGIFNQRHHPERSAGQNSSGFTR